MDKENLKSILTIIIIIGIVLAGLMWLGISMLKSGNGETISVQGSYSQKLNPDKVWMSIGIETQAKLASDAESENKEISNGIYTSLDNLGLTSTDYQTESYNVYPTYDYNYGNKITGYTVSHRIRIDTDKINLASSILDAAVNAGANSIYGVNFDLSENSRETAKANALKKATESAKTKAESIAAGLGAKLGRIKSVSDSNINYLPYIYAEVASAEVREKGASSIITESGSVEVSAGVSIVYNIR